MKFVSSTLLFILGLASLEAQSYKNDISVVQYSASFIKDAEISLKPFRDAHTYTFLMDNKKQYFIDDNVKYLPTIVIYKDGEEVYRVEAGIDLNLPKDTDKLILEKLDELLEDKF